MAQRRHRAALIMATLALSAAPVTAAPEVKFASVKIQSWSGVATATYSVAPARITRIVCEIWNSGAKVYLDNDDRLGFAFTGARSEPPYDFKFADVVAIRLGRTTYQASIVNVPLLERTPLNIGRGLPDGDISVGNPVRGTFGIRRSDDEPWLPLENHIGAFLQARSAALTVKVRDEAAKDGFRTEQVEVPLAGLNLAIRWCQNQVHSN